ncbi:MAG: Gfo/Idh/MocA family oxidoreductase, partial [Verrucomicrobiota bacterium]
MVKLAVIGTGGMANNHAQNFSKMNNCTLVAGCDIDAEKVGAFCEKHGIDEVYTDYGKMLTEVDCDAVTIVTPDAFHHSIALDAIKAGKHVLCEKPLAMKYEEAAEMSDAANEAGVINMVNFSYRNSSAIQKAAQLAAAGELGVVRHAYAYYLQSWLAQDAWGFWETDPKWLWRL